VALWISVSECESLSDEEVVFSGNVKKVSVSGIFLFLTFGLTSLHFNHLFTFLHFVGIKRENL